MGGSLLFVLFFKKIPIGGQENTRWGASYLGLPHPISPPAMLSILALSPERAVVLLYMLLALTFVLFMALTIVNLQRGESAVRPLL